MMAPYDVDARVDERMSQADLVLGGEGMPLDAAVKGDDQHVAPLVGGANPSLKPLGSRSTTQIEGVHTGGFLFRGGALSESSRPDEGEPGNKADLDSCRQR